MIDAVEKLAEMLGDVNLLTYKGKAQAILAAIQADPLAYVKPKPLDWGEVRADPYTGKPICETQFTKGFLGYKIIKRDGVWFSFEFYGEFNDLEAAQAAAYDDLCNRVKELF